MYKSKKINKFVYQFNKNFYNDELYKGRFVLSWVGTEHKQLQNNTYGYQHKYIIYDKGTTKNINITSPILFYKDGKDNYAEYEIILTRLIMEQLRDIKIDGDIHTSTDYRGT